MHTLRSYPTVFSMAPHACHVTLTLLVAVLGLSRFGRDLVERLDAARIVVDGSHTGRQTVLDAIAIVKRPFVVSHANALAVHKSPRNLDDKVIRKVANSGGLIGPPGTPRDYPGSFDGTPIFLGCSDIDAHIPLERVKESAVVCRRMGATVDERIYAGMGHLVNMDEITAVRSLLAARAVS